MYMYKYGREGKKRRFKVHSWSDAYRIDTKDKEGNMYKKRE